MYYSFSPPDGSWMSWFDPPNILQKSINPQIPVIYFIQFTISHVVNIIIVQNVAISQERYPKVVSTYAVILLGPSQKHHKTVFGIITVHDGTIVPPDDPNNKREIQSLQHNNKSF